MSGRVQLEARNGVALAMLDNPPLNLVDQSLLAELGAAMAEVERDDRLAALILTGAGKRAFCAGSDLNVTLALKRKGRFLADKLAPETEIFSRLANFPKPTIAALGAPALGGGLEIACCCDLIVAEEGVQLGLPEINIAGFPPSAVVRLARRIGLGRLNELVLLGRPIDAGTALAWGLVNRVAFPPDSALHLAFALAEPLVGLPKRALQFAKRAIALGGSSPPEAALPDVLRLSDHLARQPDAIEGALAFVEKRPAVFTDRIAPSPDLAGKQT